MDEDLAELLKILAFLGVILGLIIVLRMFDVDIADLLESLLNP